jgi:hypothetical protein
MPYRYKADEETSAIDKGASCAESPATKSSPSDSQSKRSHMPSFKSSMLIGPFLTPAWRIDEILRIVVRVDSNNEVYAEPDAIPLFTSIQLCKEFVVSARDS